jgi:predicted PurR-regulated permease PerM
MAADQHPSTPRAKKRTPATEHEAIEVPRAEQQWFRWAALAVITLALVTLTVMLTLPYLSGLTWGIALAIIAWPMHRAILHWVPWPRVAAAASTFIVTTIILGAGGFVTYWLAQEAQVAVDNNVQSDVAIQGLKERIAEWPMVGQVVDWLRRLDVNIGEELRKAAAAIADTLRAVAQGSLAMMIQFLVMIFALYYLLLDHELLLGGLRDTLPLTTSESDQVFQTAADSVHANVYATFITSIIDSVTGGLVFWAVDLPGAFIWAVVMFILGLLPIVGAGLVWVPAVVVLAATGRWLGAGAILAWGITVFIVVDNILYVRLVGNRMRMHPVPALIAFIGGLAVFGVSGMILGPAIVAVTMAFFDVWRQRMRKTPA